MTDLVDEILKLAVQHGLPAAISLVAGGTGGVVLTKFLRRNPLGNVDFKILPDYP